ncbi:MAG: hypothetical protein U0529_13535 [Thermoanaerobaculia bacterium]
MEQAFAIPPADFRADLLAPDDEGLSRLLSEVDAALAGSRPGRS